MTTHLRGASPRHTGRSRRVSLGRGSLAAVALFSFLLPASFMAAAAEEGDVPEPLRKLERLTGSWTTDRVELLRPDGSVRELGAASAHNEFQLDGNVLVHRGRLLDPAIETRGWYYVSPADGRLHMASVSDGGRYDEFAGGWEEERLVMVSVPSRSTGDRLFRMTHAAISESAYRESLEVSEDGGKTWRTSSRQTMRRVDPVAVLEVMDAYTGTWRSDEKTASNGARLHFVYELDWLDADETIAHMVITRVDAKGESIVFEGYKGLDPAGTVYYHAASPSGRGARGIVVLEGDNLVTVYDGWAADGSIVQIRDVFEPASDATFISRTWLKAPDDTDWRQVAEDAWSRTEPAPGRASGS